MHIKKGKFNNAAKHKDPKGAKWAGLQSAANTDQLLKIKRGPKLKAQNFPFTRFCSFTMLNVSLSEAHIRDFPLSFFGNRIFFNIEYRSIPSLDLMLVFA